MVWVGAPTKRYLTALLHSLLCICSVSSLDVALYSYVDWPVDLPEPPPNPFKIPQGIFAVFEPQGFDYQFQVLPFYYMNYTREQNKDGTEKLSPRSSEGSFRLRFTPNTTGMWHWYLSGCSVNGSQNGTFVVTEPAAHRGFARIGDGGQFFEVNADVLYLLGQDIVFPGRDPILTNYNYTNNYTYSHWGTYMYDVYLTKMEAAGGNYVRLWIGLSTNATKSTPLSLAGGPAGSFGFYDLEAAWRIEYIISLAEKLGVYVLLCFEAQQSLQMLYPYSVYSSQNGGPLSKPSDWWNSTAVENEFKQRLQYAISRYGHSTAVFSWQLFNEWNDWPAFSESRATVLQKQYSDFLRKMDPYNHLVHNSFGADPVTSLLSDIDFATFHKYGAPDFGQYAVQHVGLQGYATKKPFFWEEFGLSADGTTDGTEWWSADAASVHIHNALWGSVVSTAAGAPMRWWWHEFDEHNAYQYFTPVLKFVERLPLLNHTWVPFDTPAQNASSFGSCNRSKLENMHFDTSAGTVLSHFVTSDPDACLDACCNTTECSGWVYTTSQDKGSFPPCDFEGKCCWLKSAVDAGDLLPIQNTTCGITQEYSGWQATGMRGTANGVNDSVVFWIRSKSYTWKLQDKSASNAPIGPVQVDIPAMVSGTYIVQVISTRTGESTQQSHVTVPQDVKILSLEIPQFTRDCAVIATRLHTD